MELAGKVRHHQYLVGNIVQDVTEVGSNLELVTTSFKHAGALADGVLGATADTLQDAIKLKDPAEKDAALRRAAAALKRGGRNVCECEEMASFGRKVGPLAQAAAAAS